MRSHTVVIAKPVNPTEGHEDCAHTKGIYHCDAC